MTGTSGYGSAECTGRLMQGATTEPQPSLRVPPSRNPARGSKSECTAADNPGRVVHAGFGVETGSFGRFHPWQGGVSRRPPETNP